MCPPLGLSQVSHSPYLVTCCPTSNTTTRRRRATASHPRLQTMPLTLSLNSSSATSQPRASSHKITLFGGYNGLRPPPRRKRMFDVCNGTTAESVPPVSSKSCVSVKRRQKLERKGTDRVSEVALVVMHDKRQIQRALKW